MELEVAEFIGMHASEQASERWISDSFGDRPVDLGGDELGDQYEEHLEAESAKASSRPKETFAPVIVEHVDLERRTDQGLESGVLLLFDHEEPKCVEEVVGDDALGGVVEVETGSGLAQLEDGQ